GDLGRGRGGPAWVHRRAARARATGRGVRGRGGPGVSTLGEILRTDFLLRDALLGSVLLGFVCPLIGVYFLLRRMIFLGIALPQLSAAGIGVAFLLYSELIGPHRHGAGSERLLALVGSFAITMAGLVTLAALERGGRVV